MNEAIREQISAYVDGELPENEAELLIRRLSQDAELRDAAAEYLALGRLLRDEAGLAAADRLRDKVAASLDSSLLAADEADDSIPAARRIKPLAGAAIAATVALVALFALQTTTVEPVAGSDELVGETTAAPVPTSTSPQELHREMLLRHANATSDLGANGINSRLIALEFDEALESGYEPESETDDAQDDEPASDDQSQ